MTLRIGAVADRPVAEQEPGARLEAIAEARTRARGAAERHTVAPLLSFRTKQEIPDPIRDRFLWSPFATNLADDGKTVLRTGTARAWRIVSRDFPALSSLFSGFNEAGEGLLSAQFLRDHGPEVEGLRTTLEEACVEALSGLKIPPGDVEEWRRQIQRNPRWPTTVGKRWITQPEAARLVALGSFVTAVLQIAPEALRRDLPIRAVEAGGASLQILDVRSMASLMTADSEGPLRTFLETRIRDVVLPDERAAVEAQLGALPPEGVLLSALRPRDRLEVGPPQDHLLYYLVHLSTLPYREDRALRASVADARGELVNDLRRVVDSLAAGKTDHAAVGDAVAHFRLDEPDSLVEAVAHFARAGPGRKAMVRLSQICASADQHRKVVLLCAVWSG